MKAIALMVSFVSVFSFMSFKYVFQNSAPEDSVMGVSHSLACPCECPMVLEDCHMSCGLTWKDNIGEKLKVGLKKIEITSYFFKRYGHEALLTPAQRMAGKWYEVSRGGYPLKDMILFGLIVLVWTVLVYTGLMMIVEKYQSYTQKSLS
jgi:cytochrome c-type biogenesis protein CcmH/NrfF